MSTQVLRRFAVGGTAAFALLLLQGCGGGGGTSAEDPQAPLSVVQYAASVGAAASAPLTRIDVGPQAQNFNDSRILASDMLRLALAGGAANAAAVPSLLYAQLDLWRAAASGDTLAQLNQLFPLPADPTVAQARTNPVTRQLWAHRGATFTPAFLDASLLPALGGLEARWQAAETGLADLGFLNDAAMTQALAPWSELGVRPTASDFSRLRLWAVDALKQQLVLPGAGADSGVFQAANGELKSVPLVLRMSTGVQRVDSSNHVAQVLDLGGRRLITVTPLSGTLAEFVNDNSLVLALDIVTSSVRAGQTTPGTMLLPAGTLSLTTAHPAWLGQAGLTLPFDTLNANLRSLDGQGGSHVEVTTTDAVLRLEGASLGFAATAASSFVFDPANVNGASFGVGVSLITDPGNIGINAPCPRIAVDLRPFFLVLVDEFNAVQWVAAVSSPAGATPCTMTPASGSGAVISIGGGEPPRPGPVGSISLGSGATALPGLLDPVFDIRVEPIPPAPASQP